MASMRMGQHRIGTREYLLERLAELSALQDDWDSYGGASPTAIALRRAELLVSDLINRFPALGKAAIPDEMFPNPDGGIELEWSINDRLLGIEIGPTGELRYLLKFGQGHDAEYRKGTIQADAADVDALLAQLR